MSTPDYVIGVLWVGVPLALIVVPILISAWGDK